MRLGRWTLNLLMGGSLFAAGCGQESTPSFSILPEVDSYKQEATDFSPKIDILWVIDNSGSMKTSQDNVAANFDSFISTFQDKGFDFQMAVITTDAYRTLFGGDPTLSQFRDGTDETSHTGVRIINRLTPNLKETFLVNMLQGTAGNGDERAFQSLKTSLEDPSNDGFLRDDAFLAVIIVSDEDDFSHDEKSYIGGQYTNPALHPVQDYVDFLSGLKSASTAAQKLSVSAIAIWDEECRAALNDAWPGRRIGVRYEEIVDLTSGIKGSLCGDFSVSLQDISQNIIQLSTQFYLTREPILDSIRVSINGNDIAQDEVNGWTYDANNMSIIFHGASIPPQGATISINYDPVTIVL